MYHRILALSVFVALLTSVEAQSFNVNCDSASIVRPPDSYTGAASQAGKWNQVDLNVTGAKPLKLLTGKYSGCLSLQASKKLGTMGWPDTTTTGKPFEDLVDTFTQVDGTGADIVVSGMRPGSYRVWVYGRHAISCKYSCTIPMYTNISVNGSALQGCGGGGGLTGHSEGATYRKFDVTVTSSGKLTIHIQPKGTSTYGAINGFQVKCLGTGAQCLCTLSASPVIATHADGVGGVYPFGNNPAHILQVHREPAGTVADFTGVAFRRDRRTAAPNATARVVDLELWAGLGDLSKLNPVFAKCYTSTPTNVLRRKRVSLPDWSKPPTQSTAPFDFVLKFDRPFRYSGRGDFVWEMMQYSKSNVSHPMDMQNADTTRPGGFATYGTGCTLPRQTLPMSATLEVSVNHGAQRDTWSLDGRVQNAAPSSVCGFMFGFRDVSIPFALTCSRSMRLYTDASFVLPGRSDANGNYRTPAIAGVWNPGYAGLHIYSQAVSASQNDLAFSNGVDSRVPSMPQPGPYAWVRASGGGSSQGQIGAGTAIVTKLLR